ncbi:MAG: asparagine synthetase B, partial [Planctomycetes bacterium]|nr:asparagine synthetase B [Planctomycetota bacterium]
MCGLCGIAGADVASLAGRLEPMIASLAHRGPDGEGRTTAPSRGCVLGHRRLSVIDLGAGSAQPMSSPDGRRVLAYNGELYNYRELREELVRGGARFRTQGDTEVVLEALSAWGE